LLPTVAIVGAGPLGRWLALSAARAGFRVLLEDVMPLNLRHAQEYIRQQLGPASQGSPDTVLKGHGLSRANEPPKQAGDLAPEECHSDILAPDESAPGFGLSKIAFVSTIEDAVRQADLVIDCVPDELESKLEILWLLDRMAPPRTVLATPTMRLSIADLANCTYRPEKVIAIGAEACSLAGSPVPAASAGSGILLRTTARTSPETVALLRLFWEHLGFSPVFEMEAAG
jgi:3-hydroxybutyryl-CoA dehydrogenase